MSEGLLVQKVFAALAGGERVSGQSLASRCEVSRTAVWKAIGVLQRLGVTIAVEPRRGYRLTQPVVPLDRERIVAAVPSSVRPRIRHGEVRWSVDSTNTELLARAGLPVGQHDFLLAECQLAGRGRRARRWLAPPGGAICLSLARQFAGLRADFGALSLVTGLAVRESLRSMRDVPVQLKWPNDLLVGERKLGGILIELRAEAAGPAYVVIGIGLNVALGADLQQSVAQTGVTPVDLAALGWSPCDRNALAAEVIGNLISCIDRFEQQGFAGFSAPWREADALEGRAVNVATSQGVVAGDALGVAADGTLRVRTSAGEQRFASGEVSVRMAP